MHGIGQPDRFLDLMVGADTSMPNESRATSKQKLTGWGEIASYLRCSIRTAQRMEREGLPVRRSETSNGGSQILAFSDEIDDWVRSRSRVRPVPARRWRRQLITLAPLPAALTLVVLWWIWPRVEPLPPPLQAARRLPLAEMFITLETGIVVLDESSGRLVRDIALPQGSSFTQLVAARFRSGDPETWLATGQQSGAVSFNVATEAWGNWVAIPGRRIKAAAFSGLGRAAAIDQDGFVHLIDTTGAAVIGEVAIPKETFDGASRAATEVFYTSNRDQGMLSLIAHRQVISTLRIGRSAGRIVLAPDERSAFVTNHYHAAVSCVDLERNSARTARVGNYPWHLAITPSGRTLAVSNRDDATISLIDTTFCRPLATSARVFDAGVTTDEIAFGMNGRRLYVSDTGSRLAAFDVTAAGDALQHRYTLTMPGTIVGLTPSLESQRATP